ncbi:hypothetical protein N2152v2_000033 [Parachlorella kessleri]
MLLRVNTVRVCVARLQHPKPVPFTRARPMTSVRLHKTAGEGPQPETIFRPDAAKISDADPTEIPFPDLPKPEYDPGQETPKPMSPPQPDNPMPEIPPNHPKEVPSPPSNPEVPTPRTSPGTEPGRIPPEFTPPSMPEYPGRGTDPAPEISPGYQPVPEVSPQYPNRMGASSPDRRRQEIETPKGPIA